MLFAPIKRIPRRYRNIPKKNMNWNQAKRKYPRLNPFGDADRDGVMNLFDCRPFNKRKQDEEYEEGNRVIGGNIPPTKENLRIARSMRKSQKSFSKEYTEGRVIRTKGGLTIKGTKVFD